MGKQSSEPGNSFSKQDKSKETFIPPVEPAISEDPAATPPEKKQVPLATPQGAGGKQAHTNKTAGLSEDKKPTVGVVFDGKYDRRRRAVDIGISEQLLPPWTRGTVAVYKVLTKERIDPATGQPPEDTDLYMPGSYMLYDKYEPDPLKSNKLMTLLGRPKLGRNEKNEQKIEDTVLDVEFTAGMKSVNVDSEYRLYIWMELHPLNKTNRFRDHSQTPYFERIDIKNNKSEFFISAELDLGRIAEDLVLKIKDRNELIGLAVSANDFTKGATFRMGDDPGTAKNSLRKFARENPRAFLKLTNNPLSANYTVVDAMNIGVVSYDAPTKSFRLTENNQLLFTHSPSDSPVDSFVEYMSRPNQKEVLKMVTDLLNYWE